MGVGTLENEQGVTKSPEMSLDSFFLEIFVGWHEKVLLVPKNQFLI